MLVRVYQCSFPRRHNLIANSLFPWVLHSFCPPFHSDPLALGVDVSVEVDLHKHAFRLGVVFCNGLLLQREVSLTQGEDDTYLGIVRM